MPSREKKESTGLMFCSIFVTQPMVAHINKIVSAGWWRTDLPYDSMILQSGANNIHKENWIMSLGRNLQYLRRLNKNMTQETLAEKLNVSRQTISKWEMDSAFPEMEKAIELCDIFHCTLDNLFREEMDKQKGDYSNIRVEEVEGFCYVVHTVISTNPEGDALDRVIKYAQENGVTEPRIIGWDFPTLSTEQVNVYNMHGYTAAWILPEGIQPEGLEIKENM